MGLRGTVVLFGLLALSTWGGIEERAQWWLPWPSFVFGGVFALLAPLKGAGWGALNPALGMMAVSRAGEKHGT
jgi:hypothetical protein